MNVKREVVATLIKAGRKDLARTYVKAAEVPDARFDAIFSELIGLIEQGSKFINTMLKDVTPGNRRVQHAKMRLAQAFAAIVQVGDHVGVKFKSKPSMKAPPAKPFTQKRYNWLEKLFKRIDALLKEGSSLAKSQDEIGIQRVFDEHAQWINNAAAMMLG